MALSRETVEKIAWLSRIAIDPMQIDTYAKDLSGILAFVEEMSGVDTSAIAPMAHPLDIAQRLRADVVTEPDQRDLMQSSAPRVEAGLYLVPKVIE